MTASSGATSGSADFDALRAAISADPQLHTEIEWLLRLSVETYNPSDRGIRFIVGSIGEWLVAFAEYAAGLISLPSGHNTDGYDVATLRAEARDLWSVKSSYRTGGSFIISNGRNGPGPGMTEATIFWSPELPGWVYGHPELHPHLPSGMVERTDSWELPKFVVADHARLHPECVIEIDIPENPGTATSDPGFEAVKILVQSGPFRRLKKMLDDVESRSKTSVVEQLRELLDMHNQGLISREALDHAVQRVTQA